MGLDRRHAGFEKPVVQTLVEASMISSRSLGPALEGMKPRGWDIQDETGHQRNPGKAREMQTDSAGEKGAAKNFRRAC